MGDERLRLFLAFPLPVEWLDPLVRWQRSALGEARALRLVAAANLHVTLAFLGSRPRHELPDVVEAMRVAVAGAATPRLRPGAYCETRTVAMLVLEDEGGAAATLQQRLADALAARALFEPEARPWLAHLTVARIGGERPRLVPWLPDLGDGSPSEVALYSSVLRSSGAQYEVLESLALGG